MTMKKLGTLTCMVALAFTMSGCSDATANISNGKEALITIDGTSVTKQDIYDMLKPNNIGNATLEKLKAQVYEKEGIEVTDEMQKTADEKLATLKEQIGASYDDAVKQAGYKDDQDVMDKLIMPSLYQSELQKKYATDNADKLFTTYHPLKAQVIQATDEANAKEALEKLEGGADFAETAKTHGTTTYDGSETIYTSESGLPDDVFNAMSTATKTGLIDKVITDTSAGKYYVIKLTNITPSEFKDEAIEKLSQVSAIATESLKFYFEKYDMTIYDIDAYNTIETNGLIVQ